jgi:predicted secreted Zn-dependent protease
MALAALLAGVTVAGAEPRITIAERLYNIEGSSVAELREAMAEHGPYSKAKDHHVPARTEATTDFRFTARWSRGACEVADIRVTADITYIYPNWLNVGQADEALADKWVEYFGRLLVHEHGHGQMVVAAAHEVEAALASMGRWKSCKELRARARARGEEILRAMAAAQISYDEETGGGETQGAVLRDDADAAPEPAIN